MVLCEKSNEDNVVIIDATFGHHSEFIVIIDATFSHHSEFIAGPFDKSEGLFCHLATVKGKPEDSY